MLARLTTRKRVDHAIEVVRRCRDRGVPATLTVYGDGPDAAALRRQVDDAGLGDAVTFAGHRTGAADAFADASWTLVTSTFEGSPLTIAEAMARGCLPVAYDIPYGPADLIADGVDGVLVADGALDAAAVAVARLVVLPSAERE
ncbi:MAG: glycosyltransferase, partial [Agromyces sp.]|nr:glycosyltransferase [Agromyces sp.]